MKYLKFNIVFLLFIFIKLSQLNAQEDSIFKIKVQVDAYAGLNFANPLKWQTGARFIPLISIGKNLKNNLKFEEEKPLKVFYEGNVVGDFYVDLLIEDEIVVELKSVQNLIKEHEVQLVNYLNGLKKEVGLLINFGPHGVEVKRKYQQPSLKAE